MDRIATRAGVNKAMLYYHFGSKKALYTEVLRDMFRAVGVRARAIADGPGPAVDKLDAWISTIIEQAAARPWFPPIMLRELASGAPRLDPETFAMMNVVYGAVRDIVEQGQREGVFADVDPLMTHLTIMPPILIYFARERVLAAHHEHAGRGRAAAARRVRGPHAARRAKDGFEPVKEPIVTSTLDCLAR